MEQGNPPVRDLVSGDLAEAVVLLVPQPSRFQQTLGEGQDAMSAWDLTVLRLGTSPLLILEDFGSIPI